MGLPLGCLRKKTTNLPAVDLNFQTLTLAGARGIHSVPFLLHIRLFLSFFCVASSSQFFPAQALPERLRPRLGPHGQRGICLQPADRLSLRLITAQFSREPVLPASVHISGRVCLSRLCSHTGCSSRQQGCRLQRGSWLPGRIGPPLVSCLLFPLLYTHP